jgi:hypothetical protein
MPPQCVAGGFNHARWIPVPLSPSDPYQNRDETVVSDQEEPHFRKGLLDSLMPVFCSAQPHGPTPTSCTTCDKPGRLVSATPVQAAPLLTIGLRAFLPDKEAPDVW